MRVGTLAVLALILSRAAGAATLHVPADYPTIGAATAAAGPGDSILVAPGTYNERFTLGPGQDGVKIHSESGPAVTIIDGGYTGPVVSMTLVGSGTELAGFTITRGGHNSSLPPDLGAGIRLDRASPTIENVIVTKCKANQGAIYSLNGSAVINHSLITGNTSQQGGGIYIEGGAPTVLADSITNNQAYTGAGIYLVSSSAHVQNNVFQGNSAVSEGSGGGAYVAQMTGGSFQDNVLDSNVGRRGAGIYVVGPAAISSNTITNNRAIADSEGGGIFIGDGSPTVSNNTIANNTGYLGAGMFVGRCSPVVESNVFRENDAGSGGGGGAYLNFLTGGSFRNNQLLSNQANGGGGLIIDAGSFPIQGNVFLQNGAAQGGGIYDYDDNSSLVEDNQFLSNRGGGIYLNHCNPTIHRNLFQDNDSPLGPGGGIDVVLSSPAIDLNLVLRNHSGTHGGGISIGGGSPVLTGNTMVLNKADVSGGNVYVEGQSVVSLTNNILSHSPQQGLFQNGSNTVTLSCNDVSNNAGGNYTGVADPTGTNGNISLDPLFCNLIALDVHLAQISPCTAANAPAGCSLIGALDIGCQGQVRTEVTTWGSMKARYR